ncbi:BatD family protein [Xanthobacter agilis]|uniref:DUF7939 domain-containing protein n=1 Tax=Xanthobacter agilis TaxID=47492 RepID=A0ABU0LF74_XANAG|nr:BatD family protein [Xanthobacter agilis]MDQ0505790.1 hypothetical protein [Xanthobacter agilis]
MKTNSRFRPWLALPVAALLAGPAEAASVSAAPDRFVVPAGETFDFIVSLTDGESWQPPDVSALGRDFEIVDRRRASHAEMVDGKPVHVDQWVMTLLPRRTGTLTLPPVTVGGLASAPAQVQVVPAAAGQVQTDDEPLFVRVEAAAGPAYVQSDVPVTIRIYDAIGMRSGSMEKPLADGASFTEDGGQRSYVKTVGRRRYRVIEQSYLMRPQKSGVITIPPVSLNASVPGFQGSSVASDLPSLLGRSGFGEPGQRTVTVKSQPVSVRVQPRPEGVTGWFLPALGVTLSQQWSAPVSDIKVGDTVTRTLTLVAKGASPNQLPPLDLEPVDGLRQYVEESRTDATLIDGMAGAVLTKRFSLVPTRPGSFTLPAIEVPWWNLATNQQEKAVLPAVTLEVRPGAEPLAPAAPASPAAVARSPASTAEAPPAGEGLPVARLLRENRLALALLAGGVAGALVLFMWLGRRSRVMNATAGNPTGGPAAPRRRRGPLRAAPVDPEQLMAALIAACRKGEARAAHDAYGRLARLGLFAAPPADLQSAAARLARHLYGGESRDWNGRALLAAVRRAERRRVRAGKRPSGARLAPLYPGSR